MNKSFSVTLVVMIAMMLLPGCIGATIGKPIVTWQRDSDSVPKLSEVSRKGLYAIYPGDGTTPLEAVYLNPGDQFGFQNQDGKVVGVYVRGGMTKVVALEGVLWPEYDWKWQGDKQP